MTYAELLPILLEKKLVKTRTPPRVPNELLVWYQADLSSAFHQGAPDHDKKKVKRQPMISLTYRGIIVVQVANKNHEDSSEDDNRLQRLARGATILFAQISCFSTHFNRGNLPPSLKYIT
ncbi:hypothetical protein MTR_0600s0020 [Medicago truncatula]|uniref:Uncharacterized protein n=1 Tax=Medicago truncatula TaxID=3880 RepID=A0A072TFF7_MEDTR|nr:hypothetical protein MTR_0600s0020 [Medicago truncatula]